jgi:hypothetical protein
MTKREVLDVMDTGAGFVGVVEIREMADRWVALSERGYVFVQMKPHTLTLVQADAKRWVLVDEDGEITPAVYRANDLELAYRTQAQAAYPFACRGWQWSGGRPVKSLAEADRNEAGAMAHTANTEAQRRMGAN